MMRPVAFSLCLVLASCGREPDSDSDSDASSGGGSGTSSSVSTGPGASGTADDTADDTTGDTATTETEASTGADIVPFSGELRVMSFNVLCWFCDASFDPWDERVPWIGDTIARHDPDLIGLQELVLGEEVQQLLDVAPGYAAVYWNPERGTPYPDSTIVYRESMFEPIETGFYWLSPTPDSPMSTGFAEGFQLSRLVSWVVFRRLEDDAQLYFAATHFDNNSPSQELSASLVIERTSPFIATHPVVMVGDFNSTPESEAYSILTGDDTAFTDSFDLAPDWSSVHNAARPPEYDTTGRIDHIFVAGAPWSAPSWTVDQWRYGDDDLPISDHWAIAAELSLR